MCLLTVDKETVEVSQGYKVFRIDHFSKKLFGVVVEYEFKKRRWLRDTKVKNIKSLSAGRYYPTGFHVFLDKRDALLYCSGDETIHRVLVKNIVASGVQLHDRFNLKTVVCKNLYIMEEVTE
jgi:hypothetical protein